jgi:hypothetical protein
LAHASGETTTSAASGAIRTDAKQFWGRHDTAPNTGTHTERDAILFAAAEIFIFFPVTD